ncbi:MAG: hypothetical protein A4E72_01906 [Syntrophus sp. PtaU1.Bin208]|nr:MAG: hypothetical protein A4E72_01906 [Syntrophus sp. PtaU1.Bin208]
MKRRRRKNDPGPLRQQLQSFRERRIVQAHQESEGIAFFAAAETIKHLSFPVDRERRGLFAVKGAQPQKVSPGFFQGNILRYQFDDIHPAFDFRYLISGMSSFQSATPSWTHRLRVGKFCFQPFVDNLAIRFSGHFGHQDFHDFPDILHTGCRNFLNGFLNLGIQFLF